MGKHTLEGLKLKVAKQVGVNLTEGYNGDISTKQAGLIGGNMVRELIAHAQQQLSAGTTTTYPTTNYPTTTYTTTQQNTWH